MEFRETLRRRRMIRSYSDAPVEPDRIERIVSAGLRAPSAGFSQGLRMAVVTSPAGRAELAAIAGEAEWIARGYAPWVGGAPVLLVLGVSEADYHARYREPDKLGPDGEISWPVPFWFVDAGAALMAILLAAIDEGLAAGFLGVSAVSAVRSLVGFSADVAVIGLITIGYPGEEAERVVGSALRPHKPAEAQVTWLE